MTITEQIRERVTQVISSRLHTLRDSVNWYRSERLRANVLQQEFDETQLEMNLAEIAYWESVARVSLIDVGFKMITDAERVADDWLRRCAPHALVQGFLAGWSATEWPSENPLEGRDAELFEEGVAVAYKEIVEGLSVGGALPERFGGEC